MIRRHPFVLWSLAYAGLTIAATYPLVLRLSSTVPHDLGDPLLSASILWWNAHVMPLTARWWRGFAFYPTAGSITFSDHRLGLSLLASPLQWLGASPVTAYNVTLLATFPLSAMAAHGLAFTLTGRHDAAALCGLAYGFNPYRIAHIEHLELLAGYGMPIALAALHLYLDSRRVKWMVLFGLAMLLQALSSSYYFLFFLVALPFWVVWFVRWPDWKPLVAIGTTCALCGIALLPIAVPYARIHAAYGMARGFGEIAFFGADVTSIVTGSPLLKFWGWTSTLNGPERQLFPGFTIMALTLAGGWAALREDATPRRWSRVATGLVVLAGVFFGIALSAVFTGPWRATVESFVLFSIGAPFKPFSVGVAMLILAVVTSAWARAAFARRSLFAFYLFLTIVFFIFSMGPAPGFLGAQILYEAPYQWLMQLPLFADGIRVPGRFAMLTALALSVSAALAFSRLRASSSVRRVVVVALAAGIVADSWMGSLYLPRLPEHWPFEQARGAAAVLEMPMGNVEADVAAMYRESQHGVLVVNGYSGWDPRHYEVLRLALKDRDDTVLEPLTVDGPLLVVADRLADREGETSAFLTALAGVEVLPPTDRWALFRVAPRPHPAICPGEALTIAAAADSHGAVDVANITDGSHSTWWGTKGPQRPGDVFMLDLGRAARPCGVTMFLGPYIQGYPRMLKVETSIDGSTWTAAFTGRGGGAALRAVIEQPRDVPVRIQLPPASARYLRMTLLEADMDFPWMITDAVVSGAREP